jgi:cell division protein FtsW
LDAKGKQKDKVRRGGIDIPFFVLVIILLAFGLIMMFSASFASALYRQGNSYYFIKKQLVAAGLGVAAMIFLSFWDYRVWRKFALWLFLFAILTLVAVLFIGTEVNGATRWIYIGPLNFQPSEIAKLAVIIFFAHCISTFSNKMNKFSTGILPYLAMLGFISFLMILEPHFSGTILLCAVGIILIFAGGASIKWITLFGAAGAAGLTYIILFTDYATGRIQTWLDPSRDPTGTSYQILQSLYAIGSGGLMGLGLGQSRQKYLYIPEPHNDFIFSIVCEELGFIGAMFVIILFALLIWRGFVIAFNAPDKFGSLMTLGIISLIGVQFLLNIAVVPNSIPVTGMPLPFFSYGGTSLMILLVEMGIVLSVSRYCVKSEKG